VRFTLSPAQLTASSPTAAFTSSASRLGRVDRDAPGTTWALRLNLDLGVDINFVDKINWFRQR
jgi:hypothetical protein